jgi:hypothetical protein
MGYSGFTKQIINTVIKSYDPKTVIDLGAQQNYDQPNLPAPYIDSWYKDMGIMYMAIDLSEENGSVSLNLATDPTPDIPKVDLVVDAGTSEHVEIDGAFSWPAIYNCWKIKHELLAEGGIMVSENPKTGNWPGHGYNYVTKEFYRRLEAATDYHIILLDEHPAMGNDTDGWNVMCVMQKKSERFPTMEEFQTFDLKTQ